jgi:hypothetical protein
MSPALQSRVSVQLRSPGRVVPIGSGGALGGGRWTRDSGLVVWVVGRGGSGAQAVGAKTAARARTVKTAARADRGAERMGGR